MTSRFLSDNLKDEIAYPETIRVKRGPKQSIATPIGRAAKEDTEVARVYAKLSISCCAIQLLPCVALSLDWACVVKFVLFHSKRFVGFSSMQRCEYMPSSTKT